MQELLDTILWVRTQHGWSEYQLAQQSGIPQSTISSWYCRGVTPSLHSLERVCTALGLTLSQLFGEVEARMGLTTSEEFAPPDTLLSKWDSLSEAQRRGLFQLLNISLGC